MATHLTSFSVERITSERKNNKASIQGFIYTLNRKSHDVEHWCVKSAESAKRGYIHIIIK